jgi:hypothetical protein
VVAVSDEDVVTASVVAGATVVGAAVVSGAAVVAGPAVVAGAAVVVVEAWPQATMTTAITTRMITSRPTIQGLFLIFSDPLFEVT